MKYNTMQLDAPLCQHSVFWFSQQLFIVQVNTLSRSPQANTVAPTLPSSTGQPHVQVNFLILLWHSAPPSLIRSLLATTGHCWARFSSGMVSWLALPTFRKSDFALAPLWDEWKLCNRCVAWVQNQCWAWTAALGFLLFFFFFCFPHCFSGEFGFFLL